MHCETDKTENKSALETTKYKVNSIVKRKQLNFQGTRLTMCCSLLLLTHILNMLQFIYMKKNPPKLALVQS